jgi:hypothetical protein
LIGVLGCWVVLTGCPRDIGPFALFRYLPMVAGNTWTFGCAGYQPSETGADTVSTFTVEGFRVIHGRTAWMVTQRQTSSQSESYSPDTYYMFKDGVLYSTQSTAAIADLPDSLDTGFTPFVHEDLTLRTITDTADPLHKKYNADIRYVAGALTDFVPFHFVRPLHLDATVELSDFGEPYQGLTDCVALEALLTDIDGVPTWTPVLILGRGIGPLLVKGGDGIYVTLKEARTTFAP